MQSNFFKEELARPDSLLLELMRYLTASEFDDWMNLPIGTQRDIRYYVNSLDRRTSEELKNQRWFEFLPLTTWLSLLKYFQEGNKLELILAKDDIRVWKTLPRLEDTSRVLQFSHLHRNAWRQRTLYWQKMREVKPQAPKPCFVEVFAGHPAHTFVGKLVLWCLFRPFA